MANGIIRGIVENGVQLTVSVEIAPALYVVSVSKAEFDALPTNVDKQNFIIGHLALMRRTSRQFETIFPALIGTNIVIPD